jgi:16S rRNA processing protein RimM
MPRVTIGKIRAAHGIAGEMKIETYDIESVSMKPGKSLWLESETSPRKITRVRVQRTWRIVALDGVVTRNDAEALIGREVAMDRVALPKLAKGEFYVSDVIGFAVVTVAGEEVGEVTGSSEGAQTLLVIAGKAGTPREGKELLVPCIEGIVVEIDDAAKRVRIDPPEGLLDL